MNYAMIAIIYNPNSTGPGKDLATKLKSEIKEKLPGQKVELIATKHVGHGEELAYRIARKSKRALIISSSGDGGYNEVVNGALKAQSEGANPTVGVLPAGNANDHYRNLHEEEVIDQIVRGSSRKLDVLKIEYTSNGKKLQRYAHSYIGFGLTSHIGNRINKSKVKFLLEGWIVLHSLFTMKSIRLIVGGKARSYESIIFSNVDSMSKYFTVSRPSSVTDGKFEVTIFNHRNKFRLIAMLFVASMAGIAENTQVSSYSLKTIKKTLAQLDGEIITIDANSEVVVSVDKQALQSVV